ncbi:hypothetical protein LOK49_LG12G02305 [Camellia lanceoleosa]|uniref:Uncharacterized protein n=1 Tax=Camellia lanceoleosa TaxID=1840588 RepID=A0ACC0FVB3_9ERIC|nr:hypothetical protein LOK49_LG12G02305 [Camellia lanceoleosa]
MVAASHLPAKDEAVPAISLPLPGTGVLNCHSATELKLEENEESPKDMCVLYHSLSSQNIKGETPMDPKPSIKHTIHDGQRSNLHTFNKCKTNKTLEPQPYHG